MDKIREVRKSDTIKRPNFTESTQHSMDSNKAYLKFKSEVTRQHNVDLVDDVYLNMIDWGWEASYCQRALCVRIFCCCDDETAIQRIKFITNEESSHKDPGYKWLSPPTLDTAGCSVENFYDFIERHIAKFPKQPELNVVLQSEHWSSITSHIELLDLRYDRSGGKCKWRNMAGMNGDEMKIELNKMTKKQRQYVSSFVKALKCDMLNGEAKEWIRSLMDNIYTSSSELLSDFEVHFFDPATFCKTNTQIETIIGRVGDPVHVDQMFYDASCSGCSNRPIATVRSNLSSLSLESERSIESRPHQMATTHKVVPDYVAALSEHPGMFPLVVELKPALKEEEGFYQNVRQMLSKLFFQDAIFGLVVSPRHFQMSVIIKTADGIRLKRTTLPLYDSENDAKLDMGNLNVLYKFVYGVFKWAMTTKCKTEIES